MMCECVSDMKKHTIGKSRLETLRRLRRCVSDDAVAASSYSYSYSYSSRPDFMERVMVVPSWEVRDRERRSMSLPLKSGEGGGGGGGLPVVSLDSIRDRRNELLGYDISFTNTLFMVIGLLLLLLFVWGFRPPTTECE